MKSNNMDNIDKFLINGLKSIKLEDYNDEEIKNLLSNAKNKKIKEKQIIVRAYKMVASVIFIVVVTIFGIYISNKDTNFNVIIKSNNNSTYEDNSNDELEKACVIYSAIDADAVDSRVELSLGEMYNLSNVIAIVKVDEVKVTNYDKKYEYQYKGEEGYTFVRTIGKFTILNSIKGNLKNGEKVELRKKGGRIKYKEYLKYYEEYPNESKDEEMEKECQEFIKKGTNIDDIYIDISVGFKNINIESGKTYLVYLTEKVSGYWLQASVNSVREYNDENNTILNNITGEWENLNVIENSLKMK